MKTLTTSTVVAVVTLGTNGMATGKVAVSVQERARVETEVTEKSSTETDFLLAGMSCAGCANHAAEVLRKIPGVREAMVDFDSEKATIKSDRQITVGEVREALGTLGFDARFPGDLVIQPLSKAEKAGLDIRTASHGEAIKLKDHLAPGKITIFDYYADWCGPCHLLSPKLERLLLDYRNLALRKVDISNWESEAAKQATKDFGLPGLPYVRIYDGKGRLLGEVQGNRVEKVEEFIKRGHKP